MSIVVQNVVCEYMNELRKVYRDSLKRVIMYGSYARGDFTEQSDVDVMILVTSSEEEIKKTSNYASDIAFDFLMRYGIDISPVIVNESHFNYWVDTLPFYRNVQKEGVQISA